MGAVYTLLDEPLAINSFLLLSNYDFSRASYRLFSTKPDAEIQKIIATADFGQLKTISEINDYFLVDLSAFGDYQKVYLGFIVKCEKETQILLECDMPGYSKLWKGQHLLTISSKRQEKEWIETLLKPGENVFIVEYFLKQKTEFPPYVYFQIYNSDYLRAGKLLPGIDHLLNSFKIKVIGKYIEEEKAIKFMVLSKEEYVPAILDISNSQLMQYKTKQEYTCPLPENMNPDFFQLNLIVCGNQSTPQKYSICTHITKGYCSNIIDAARTYCSGKPENIRAEILGRVEKIKNELTFLEDQFELITEIHQLIADKKLLKQNNVQRIYFLSQIDQTYQEITLVLPQNYTKNQSYPLLICFGILDFDYFFPSATEDILIANISGRGILGGGYISEAAYLESINYIKKHYCIKPDQIYLTGKSNGGFAVWHFLQNHSDFAAAAFPISGYPYEPNLQNVINTPIFNYVSSFDSCYYKKAGKIPDCIESFGNYHQTNVKNMFHHAFCEFRWFPILQSIGDIQKQNYPLNIFFRTEQNAYLKSFWIRLSGIEWAKKYAEVKASVITNSQIKIQAKNTYGIELTIPPYINKCQFTLEVNGTTLSFRNYQEKKLFIHLAGAKPVARKTAYSFDCRKGLGLLHVYTKPMRIIIPDHAPLEIQHTAAHFACPKSNGYYNALSVDYPVYRLCETDEQTRKNSLICINIDPQELAYFFKRELAHQIFVFPDKFVYKEKNYDGGYCVMQIFEHPLDKSQSILLIYTNTLALLKRNMFTRKVTIPFLGNGIHEYWNNEALIYYNNEYYSIYEWGLDMKKI